MGKDNIKQSEISGFELIKCRFRLNFKICISVSQGIFREFCPFSAIAENHWPYIAHASVKSHERNTAHLFHQPVSIAFNYDE